LRVLSARNLVIKTKLCSSYVNLMTVILWFVWTVTDKCSSLIMTRGKTVKLVISVPHA
jgi:hypothetical protein